jgi:hypothetical protein
MQENKKILHFYHACFTISYIVANIPGATNKTKGEIP